MYSTTQEPDMETRITDLEIRLTHQDAAVEELTRVVLAQESELKKLLI